MAKTKISEYSSTSAGANLNTDINTIDIDEGCAPSGINNAIRTLMAQLKDFQTGVSGDGLTLGGALSGTSATFSGNVTASAISGASLTLSGNVTASAISGASMTLSGDLTVDTNTLYVDSTNNRVGIGTSSPNSKFSIDYSSSSTSAFATYDNIPILLKNTSNTDNNWSIIACQDASGDFASYIGTQYTSQVSNTAVLTFGTNPGSGATERMRIDSSGNVGIGTTSPVSKLTVAGSSAVLSLVDTDRAVNTYGAVWADQDGNVFLNADYDGTAGGGFISFRSNGSSVGSEKMRIDSSGNVGIGTTNPSFKLQLSGSGTQTFRITSTDGANADLSCDGTSSMSLGTPNGLPIRFVTNNSERMRILSTGGVAINSTTITGNAALHVERSGSNLRIVHFENTRNVNGDECVRSVLGSNCNNTTSYHYIATTGGTDKYYLYGNGTYATASDENLKKNIETTRDGYLDDISNLRVVKYNWATDEDNTPKELGLIAQEVAQVFPNLVQDGPTNEDGNTYKQVKTSVLPFILLKALQEAITKIEDLETRIQTLENK